jgi:hypothetical protein
MRGLATTLAVLSLVTGCGTGDERSADPARGCTAEDAAHAGRVVATADLDGHTGPEELRLMGPRSGPCRNRLVAVVDGRLAAADVRGLGLAAKPGTVVHLRGRGDLVLLESKAHPRGGWQPHLFAGGGPDGLAEVTVAGHPVLPFVATDGGGSPMTATCTPSGGIAVFTAIAHEPPGVVLAWDVTRTTYSLRDGRAEPTGSMLVEEAAADPTLRRERPELFSGELFAGCG